jgi:hypothetical protein
VVKPEIKVQIQIEKLNKRHSGGNVIIILTCHMAKGNFGTVYGR